VSEELLLMMAEDNAIVVYVVTETSKYIKRSYMHFDHRDITNGLLFCFSITQL